MMDYGINKIGKNIQIFKPVRGRVPSRETINITKFTRFMGKRYDQF